MMIAVIGVRREMLPLSGAKVGCYLLPQSSVWIVDLAVFAARIDMSSRNQKMMGVESAFSQIYFGVSRLEYSVSLSSLNSGPSSTIKKFAKKMVFIPAFQEQ